LLVGRGTVRLETGLGSALEFGRGADTLKVGANGRKVMSWQRTLDGLRKNVQAGAVGSLSSGSDTADDTRVGGGDRGSAARGRRGLG
jgi:hypothetical protein